METVRKRTSVNYLDNWEGNVFFGLDGLLSLRLLVSNLVTKLDLGNSRLMFQTSSLVVIRAEAKPHLCYQAIHPENHAKKVPPKLTVLNVKNGETLERFARLRQSNYLNLVFQISEMNPKGL